MGIARKCRDSGRYKGASILSRRVTNLRTQHNALWSCEKAQAAAYGRETAKAVQSS
jgi:hypothetical protein